MDNGQQTTNIRNNSNSKQFSNCANQPIDIVSGPKRRQSEGSPLIDNNNDESDRARTAKTFEDVRLSQVAIAAVVDIGPAAEAAHLCDSAPANANSNTGMPAMPKVGLAVDSVTAAAPQTSSPTSVPMPIISEFVNAPTTAAGAAVDSSGLCKSGSASAGGGGEVSAALNAGDGEIIEPETNVLPRGQPVLTHQQHATTTTPPTTPTPTVRATQFATVSPIIISDADQLELAEPNVTNSTPTDAAAIAIVTTPGSSSQPTTTSSKSSSTDQTSEDATTISTTTTTTANNVCLIGVGGVGKTLNDCDCADAAEHDADEHAEDIKPLLSATTTGTVAAPSSAADATTLLTRKPRSIVKSPSNRSFGATSSSTETAPFAAEPARPVLHVKFHHHHHQNGVLGNSVGGMGDSTPASSVSSTSSSSTSSSSSSSSSDDEEGSSGGQYSEARPPDGGWGWVVVFASFVINLIADGITFSFGVIYVEFLAYFGEGKGKTAWIGSLFMAMPLLSGPIASFLTDRYGCRRVTIVGSILACLGFVLSAFSTSMEQLFLTFGILAGFGLSLCYVAAVVIVAYYFDKRRSFATGLSVCGSGIGTFIFAPLTQLLIETYGWRGTTLILAGFFLNMTVCGMLMRDLEWTTHRHRLKAKQRKQRGANRLGISAESFSVSNSTNTGGTASNLHQQQPGNAAAAAAAAAAEEMFDSSVNPRLFSSLITLPTYLRNGERIPPEVLELLASHRNEPQAMQPTLSHSRSFNEPSLSASRHSQMAAILTPPPPTENALLSPSNPERHRSEKSRSSRRVQNEQAFLTWLKRDGAGNGHGVGVVGGLQRHDMLGAAVGLGGARHPTAAYLKDLKMHRHSLTYRGAMLNINRYRLRASSCPDIYRNSMTTIAKEKVQWGQTVEEIKNLFAAMLDLSYFADIRFLLFALSNFFLYTWYDVPYVYLTDNAIELNHSETDASMLISYIGIVNMFGEIFLGWCGDKKHVSAGVIYAICMGLCGIVTACVPLFKSYVGLSVISGMFGLFIAANYALTSIILVELITIDRFTNAYGLLLLVQGIANLVGPPLAGWITDVTGNYDLAFYLSGFFIAVSGALMFILPVHGRVKKYKALRRQRSSEDAARDVESNRETIRARSNSESGRCNGVGGAGKGSVFADCFGKDAGLNNKDGENHV